jgi:hypothetical protein
MADECKLLGEIILKILRCFKDRQDTSALQGQAVAKLEEVAALADNINVSLMGVNAGNLVDMLGVLVVKVIQILKMNLQSKTTFFNLMKRSTENVILNSN